MFSYFPFMLHLSSSVFALYLAIKVFLKNPGSPLNRTFSYMMFCCFIWSLGDAIIQNPSSSLETAWLGSSIASPGWSLAVSVLFIFLLEFSGHKKLLQNKLLYPAIFIIPAIIIYQQWNNSFFSHVREYYGWGLVWPSTLPAYLFYVSILAMMAMCVNTIGTFLQNEKDPLKIKQAKILITDSFVNFSLIFISTIVLPMLEITEVPVIGDVFVSIWGAWLFFGGQRYGLFVNSPEPAGQFIINDTV